MNSRALTDLSRVPDDQLNAFSNFVVQDMEQATRDCNNKPGSFAIDYNHSDSC